MDILNNQLIKDLSIIIPTFGVYLTLSIILFRMCIQLFKFYHSELTRLQKENNILHEQICILNKKQNSFINYFNHFLHKKQNSNKF